MNHENDDDSHYALWYMCALICSLDRPFHHVVAGSFIRSFVRSFVRLFIPFIRILLLD